MATEMTSMQLELKRLELMERQIALQEQQAAALETQVERTAPKDNPNYVPKSVFHDPTGKLWSASLKCEIYRGPEHFNDMLITKEECEQLNRLMPLEHGLIAKADRTEVQASVVPTYGVHGQVTKLVIQHRMGRDDNPQYYPPLDELAKQLADQADAVIA